LDLFKKTGQATLPIYERTTYVGELLKKDLLQVITKLLGEDGEPRETYDDNQNETGGAM